MDYKVLKNEDFNISDWSGGKTCQLAIYPEDSDYLKRNFLWRLSSATCELDESDFSYLPDYDRILVVLEGKVVLVHEGIRTAHLDELEQDNFSGGYRTKSYGRITDYNLMVRKGNEGFIDVIKLTGADEIDFTDAAHEGCKYIAQTIFMRDGYADVEIDGEAVMLAKDQQLVINYGCTEKLKLSIKGEGHVIHCRIYCR